MRLVCCPGVSMKILNALWSWCESWCEYEDFEYEEFECCRIS